MTNIIKTIYILYLLYICLNHNIILFNLGVFFVLLVAHGIDIVLTTDPKKNYNTSTGNIYKYGMSYFRGLFSCNACGETNTWYACPNRVNCVVCVFEHCDTIDCEEDCVI